MKNVLYNEIGVGYKQTRHEDENLYKLILKSLGNAQTVLNVGAGTGSYEPKDRQVIAVEPSEVMVSQRLGNKFPVIKAKAEKLPFHFKTFDAAMTVLSLHHWHPNQRQGVEEMCRVSRDKVVIVTCDPRVSAKMWLMVDYFPEVAQLDHDTFPLPETIVDWLGVGTEILPVPIHKNTADWSLMSFWAHPERVLDPIARASTSGFARQPKEVIERVVNEVEQDLKNGQWDERYGYLRQLKELDVGLRVIVANLNNE